MPAHGKLLGNAKVADAKVADAKVHLLATYIYSLSLDNAD